jgi:hypothetical protein
MTWRSQRFREVAELSTEVTKVTEDDTEDFKEKTAPEAMLLKQTSVNTFVTFVTSVLSSVPSRDPCDLPANRKAFKPCASNII